MSVRLTVIKRLLAGLTMRGGGLAIFARISREETELQALIDTLDRLTISTLILSDTGTIVRMNSAAKRLLALQEIARERDNRLILVDRLANTEFQAIVAQALAARSSDSDASFAQAVRLEASHDRHVGVLVRTIEHSKRYSGSAGPACVVYISGGATAQPLDRLITQLFVWIGVEKGPR